MDVLIRFGFTIEEIHCLMETNHFIEDVEDSTIKEFIHILEEVGCEDSQIKSIILCNPFYLSRNIQEVQSFIQKLKEMGFSYLPLVFDTNPYLLNMDANELEKLYNRKIHEGFSKEEVIDYINYHIVL